MNHILVLGIGIWLFATFAKRFGARNTLKWGATLILASFPLYITGLLWVSMLPKLAVITWVEIGAIGAVGFALAAKQMGLPRALTGLLGAACVAGMFTILGALFYGTFALISKGGR